MLGSSARIRKEKMVKKALSSLAGHAPTGPIWKDRRGFSYGDVSRNVASRKNACWERGSLDGIGPG